MHKEKGGIGEKGKNESILIVYFPISPLAPFPLNL